GRSGLATAPPGAAAVAVDEAVGDTAEGAGPQATSPAPTSPAPNTKSGERMVAPLYGADVAASTGPPQQNPGGTGQAYLLRGKRGAKRPQVLIPRSRRPSGLVCLPGSHLVGLRAFRWWSWRCWAAVEKPPSRHHPGRRRAPPLRLP